MLVLARDHIIDRDSTYSLHIHDRPGRWNYPLHGHDGFMDFTVVERGVLHQRINGDGVTLRSGEAVLVRSGDRHELWGEDLRFHNINLPEEEWRRLAGFAGGELGLERLERAATAPRLQLGAGQRNAILADLAELIAHRGGSGARLTLIRFLLRWLPGFSAPASAQGGSGPAWLDPLLRRIEDGLESGLTAAGLPRLAGVSAAHLARTFRRHLGLTPSQHLNQIRLRRAALRLARSDEPVLDIAYALGFSTPGYFYRLFVRAYGVPPAAYRKRHRLP